MDKKAKNPCFKCGTERVFLNTWKEEVTTFTGKVEEITFFQTVCPHKECQELVEAENKVEEAKRLAIRVKRKDNEDARKNNALLLAKQAQKAKLAKKNIPPQDND